MSHYGAVEVENGQSEKIVDANNYSSKFSFRAYFVVLAVVCISAFAVLNNQSTQPTTSAKFFEQITTTRVTYSLLSDEEKETMFNNFIVKYDRSYNANTDSEEYNKRLLVFKDNLDISDMRNRAEAAAGGDAVHGISKFFDLTAEEFYVGYLMSQDPNRRRLSQPQHSSKQRRLIKDNDPTIMSKDWSNTITSSIKDSGSCGGSWAIAAANQVESDVMANNIQTRSKDFSSQQLLSCTPNQGGCMYGNMEDAFSYILSPGGIYATEDYPWTSSDGRYSKCYENSISDDYAVTLSQYNMLNPDGAGSPYETEKLMLDHVVSKGTLAVCVDGTTWNTYVSGTMTNCESNNINICVQVVGIFYETERDTGAWKIRNSWGDDWGDGGYTYLNYGDNACSIANSPFYTTPGKI